MGLVEAVAGILFDASVLLPYQEGSSLQPSAQSLLRRLRHSGIRSGIFCGEGFSDDEVGFLKSMAMQYSFNHFLVGASSSAIDEVNAAWNDIGGAILCVISNNKKDDFTQLATSGWLFLILDVEGAVSCPNSYRFHINKLEELPLAISNLNKKAIGSDVVTVAYIMKNSREEDFAKRGAFPIQHTPNGLIFLPITFDLPLASQLRDADVILHKATDEILSIVLSNSPESPDRIIYTRGMQELQSYMSHHPECIAIDPLNNIYPVLDRLKIQRLLVGLEDLNSEGRCAIRGPHFLKIDDFNAPGLVQRLADSKLSLPSLVKPQVACGVADAHSMAVVFRNEDFKDLDVPCPAIVQEYVDHSSTLFKFYVLGEKVFYAVKKSMPNADTMMKMSHRKGPGPLHFDSLKSLPTSAEHAGNGSNDKSLDLKLVTDAAIWLARVLDLTIFGFDVVIQEGTGDHVIVDVNYLPSFKEVPDDIAIPAFWDAIKKKFELKRSKQCVVSNC